LVSLSQLTGLDLNPNDENIAFQPVVESQTRALDENIVAFSLNLDLKRNVWIRRIGRDVVIF
jgi:hypothetical protein